jgi:DnaJ-class molecular chaperone
LQRSEPNHYAALGLDRDCTDQQIRAAYRLLARQHHPDLNPGSPEANGRTSAINAAYAVLSDPAQKQTYDRQLSSQKTAFPRAAKTQRNLSQEVHLRIEDFLRGTTLQVNVHDPVQRNDNETYELIIPPETAPGTRFRLARPDGGFVTVKVRVRPDFRFKARGADLRCDLRISSQRALRGGPESVRGVSGNFLRVQIPARVERGEIIRIAGEGLPKARGGRGDLLVRVIYRPEVRVTRASHS